MGGEEGLGEGRGGGWVSSSMGSMMVVCGRGEKRREQVEKERKRMTKTFPLVIDVFLV